jgi:transposase
MSDTGDDHMSNPVAGPVRRIEVFTGAGRRRVWSKADKAAIVAESYAGADTVSGVARRHGLTTSQLFAWRRAAQSGTAVERTLAPMFVPAVLEAASLPATSIKRPRRRGRKPSEAAGLIEIEFNGVVIRAGRGADTKTMAALIRALKVTP